MLAEELDVTARAELRPKLVVEEHAYYTRYPQFEILSGTLGFRHS